MPKDTLLPSQPKGVYRVKNWPEYNAGLIERGNVTVWMDERMFLPAPQTPDQRGRPSPTWPKGDPGLDTAPVKLVGLAAGVIRRKMIGCKVIARTHHEPARNELRFATCRRREG